MSKKQTQSDQLRELIYNEENMSLGSRTIAKKYSDKFDLSLDELANRIRRLRIKDRKRNPSIFEQELSANDLHTNWHSGWLKTKNASVYIKNGSQIDFEDVAFQIKEALKDTTGLVRKRKYRNPGNGNLLVPTIFDLHLGKLAWGEETGEDYDMKIASQRFRDCLSGIIQKSAGYEIDKILFPVGNDFFNSDKSIPFPQTTKGTPQIDDVRWQKLFRSGISLIIEAIEILSDIAPVHVVTVFSNHDHERVFYLGEVLNAVYGQSKHVHIDNSPRVRKYFKWGKNLIGLAHGHNEKPVDLPLIMAQEAKDHWSETVFREWLLGHIHHKKQLMTQTAKDYMGVNVTYMSSPSAPDAWHFEKAYIGSMKGAEGLIYNNNEGKIGVVISNIK
jgi:hypothetical protein